MRSVLTEERIIIMLAETHYFLDLFMCVSFFVWKLSLYAQYFNLKALGSELVFPLLLKT